MGMREVWLSSMILLTWTYICDLCGKRRVVSKTTELYCDELADNYPGWTGDFPVPEEHRSHPTTDICDACPECQKDPSWEYFLKICYLNS